MKFKVDKTRPSYLSYGPFDNLMREAEANSAAVPKARFGLSEARARNSKLIEPKPTPNPSSTPCSANTTGCGRRTIAKKPVLEFDAKTVLNDKSDEFQHKLLCDGLTLNAGDACVFGCTFCYVPSAMLKLHAARMREYNRESGTDLGLGQVVIRRRNFLEVLNRQLLRPDGSRVYDDAHDNRVLYSSTLVDVAATMELLKETAEACTMILQHTGWQIRLLSKSPLLARLVTDRLIPEKYHHRLILGFSTGTLDDKLAAAIECGTGLVSKRIKALHQLQDLGIRTFGMICPSLPYGTQEEYDEFSRAMCAALRVDRCEHVWAEVINLRGQSLGATVSALREAGYEAEAQRLESVSGAGTKRAWEKYARQTFEAHRRHVPAHKLRFLQYVGKDTVDYWSDQRAHGAVLLGATAKEKRLMTVGTSAYSEPLPDLVADDIRYRDEREHMIGRARHDSLGSARALHEIKTYRDGLLWRKDYHRFDQYCQERWGYQKSQAYRHVQTGEFILRLEESGSPNGESLGVTESQLRPLLTKVPAELQVECWKDVVAGVDGAVTAAKVTSGIKSFLGKRGIEIKQAKRSRVDTADARTVARSSVTKLEKALAPFVPGQRLRPMLEPIREYIEKELDDQRMTDKTRALVSI